MGEGMDGLLSLRRFCLEYRTYLRVLFIFLFEQYATVCVCVCVVSGFWLELNIWIKPQGIQRKPQF